LAGSNSQQNFLHSGFVGAASRIPKQLAWEVFSSCTGIDGHYFGFIGSALNAQKWGFLI
jgi:hypothetical protein